VLRVQRAGTMRRFARLAAGEEVIQYIRYMGWSPVLRVQRAGTMRRFARLAAGEVIQCIRYMGWLVTGAQGPEGWNNEKICAVGGR
jgi:hypothetical protein